MAEMNERVEEGMKTEILGINEEVNEWMRKKRGRMQNWHNLNEENLEHLRAICEGVNLWKKSRNGVEEEADFSYWANSFLDQNRGARGALADRTLQPIGHGPCTNG
jgi:hypothetical protein